jgi:hypothetical protein
MTELAIPIQLKAITLQDGVTSPIIPSHRQAYATRENADADGLNCAVAA